MDSNNQDVHKVVGESLSAVQAVTKELVRARRTATLFRFALFGLGVSTLITIGANVMSEPKADGNSPAPSSVASLVEIRGAIMPDSNASAAKVNPLLEKAFKDKSSGSVIIVVNSPGGTPVQSNLIRAKIDELQDKYKKPVVVVAEDMLTSGAYLIAVAADKILVDPTSVVGSIGVISKSFGFTGLMDKIGVERRVQTAGDSKNMADPFSHVTEAEKQAQQSMLNAIHDVFIETVKTSREGRLDLATPDLFSGKVWVGKQAVEAGLVDGLGSVRSAMESLEVTELIQYRRANPLGLLDIVEGIGGITAALDDIRVSTQGSASLPLAIPAE